MALQQNLNLYNIIATKISSKQTCKHNNPTKINFLDFEPINTMHNAKRKQEKKLMSLRSTTLIHEVSKRHYVTKKNFGLLTTHLFSRAITKDVKAS